GLRGDTFLHLVSGRSDRPAVDRVGVGGAAASWNARAVDDVVAAILRERLHRAAKGQNFHGLSDAQHLALDNVNPAGWRAVGLNILRHDAHLLWRGRGAPRW